MFRRCRFRKRQQEREKAEKVEMENLCLSIFNSGLYRKSADLLPKNWHHARIAADLVWFYKIDFCWSGAGVTASLPKESWINNINKKVPAGQYGSYFKDISDDKKDELISISGHGGKSFEKAVFRCVLNARTAGVI
jgi:hypothetical protein